MRCFRSQTETNRKKLHTNEDIRSSSSLAVRRPTAASAVAENRRQNPASARGWIGNGVVLHPETDLAQLAVHVGMKGPLVQVVFRHSLVERFHLAEPEHDGRNNNYLQFTYDYKIRQKKGVLYRTQRRHQSINREGRGRPDH